MKRKTNLFAVIILLLSISLTFSSCESEEEKAEATLVEFLDAIENHDFEKAKEKSTEETQKILIVIEKENEKYKEKNKENAVITYEIVERTITEKEGSFKVKIIVDGKEKVEVIKLTVVNEHWLVVMPAQQLTVIRYVVFRNRYNIFIKTNVYKDVIKVTYKHSKKKKHSKKRHK